MFKLLKGIVGSHSWYFSLPVLTSTIKLHSTSILWYVWLNNHKQSRPEVCFGWLLEAFCGVLYHKIGLSPRPLWFRALSESFHVSTRETIKALITDFFHMCWKILLPRKSIFDFFSFFVGLVSATALCYVFPLCSRTLVMSRWGTLACGEHINYSGKPEISAGDRGADSTAVFHTPEIFWGGK